MALKGDTSGLDELVYQGKPMTPLLDGFSGARRSGVVRSELPGGLTRQRKKYYNQPIVKNASFFLEDCAQQDFFMMFALRNEGKPFICHLRSGRPIIEPHVVQVVSDWDESYASMVDGRFDVQLEIIEVRDTCLDEFLFPMYQCLGSDMKAVLQGIIDIAKKAPRND